MGFVQESLRGWKLYTNDRGCGHPAPGLGIRQSLPLRTDTANSGTIETVSKELAAAGLGSGAGVAARVATGVAALLAAANLGSLAAANFGALRGLAAPNLG